MGRSSILSLFVLNYIIPEAHFCLAFPHLYFSFRKPYLCVHACTYVCTCACKCACVWTWICSDIVPQEESTLHFLNRVSDWDLGFPFNWASLTIKFQGSSFLYLPSTGTASTHHHAQLFTCLLSIELRSLTWVLFNTLQDLLHSPISVWELSLPRRQSRCCGRGDNSCPFISASGASLLSWACCPRRIHLSPSASLAADYMPLEGENQVSVTLVAPTVPWMGSTSMQLSI